MTQPLDIINDALSAIGAQAPGEYLDPNLSADAFNMLNDMLEAATNENFMVYYIQEIVANIGGKTKWTIGVGGDISSERPLGISSSFVRVSNIDYPVSVLNLEQYEMIGLKQLSGAWARALYYQPTFPLGTLNFWPLAGVGEIHLFCQQLFSRFSTINDTINFPQGYNMWMRWELAKLLAPGYGKLSQVPLLEKFANEAKGKLKITNMRPQQTVKFDPVITMKGPDAGWIMHGGFNQ